MRPRVLAVLGPTASGKSSLSLSLAERYGGEIINCDSTAVYRGFDIGTDKLSLEQRRGIPHHLIDIADPTEVYTAAQFAIDAERTIRETHRRGRLPILVGGTGFYYRALTRGLFPGPGADDALRARLDRVAARKGPERLHRILQRVDPESALRIMPRDQKRLVRALEVYYTTGRALTTHFGATRSLIADCEVISIALRLPPELTAERVARRVDEQFGRGIVTEVRDLLDRGVPAEARPFGGLVYRQVMEMLRGVRGEAETRQLIVQENRRYARRQLIWFRKEPTLIWFDGPGELPATFERVVDALAARGIHPAFAGRVPQGPDEQRCSSVRGCGPTGVAGPRRRSLMAQVTEPRASASAQSTIQDVFLNFARRDRLAVKIHLMDGRHLDARIKNFDKFAVVVEVGGQDQLVFKHAIATIETPRAVANYFSPNS